MLVLDWMKSNVITITPEKTLRQARRLFRDNNIHRLPVINNENRVVGLLLASDLNRYQPTNATGVEILETIEILDTTPVRDAMHNNPVTIHPQNTIEQAAQLMIDRYVDCLPVVDTAGKLVGIMTGMEVFRALLDLSGADQPGVEVGFLLPYKPGTLRAVLDSLRESGMRIVSVLSSVRGGGDMRKVKVRFHGDSEEAQNKALEKFNDHDGVLYWSRGDQFFVRQMNKTPAQDAK